MASKQHSTCNWVQAMEGNVDTSHISHCTVDGIDDLPTTLGQAGYPSNAMSWKFWRHDGPRLEVDDTWFGYATRHPHTPNGNTTCGSPRTRCRTRRWSRRSRSAWAAGCSCRSTTRTAGATSPRPRRGATRELRGANLFSLAPFSTPVTNPRNGSPASLHGGERLPAVGGGQGKRGIFSGVDDFVSQD